MEVSDLTSRSSHFKLLSEFGRFCRTEILLLLSGLETRTVESIAISRLYLISYKGAIIYDELWTSDDAFNRTVGSPRPVQNSNSAIPITVLGINQQSQISSLTLLYFRHPVSQRPFGHF
jgi:hypothetical protein